MQLLETMQSQELAPNVITTMRPITARQTIQSLELTPKVIINNSAHCISSKTVRAQELTPI